MKGCLTSLLIFLLFDAVVGYFGYRWIQDKFLSNPANVKMVEQIKSGKLELTLEQTNKLIPIAQRLQAGGGKLDASMAPDIAQALYIIYPDQFSDVPYWTGLLTRVLPMLSKFQLVRFPSTE